MSQSFSVSDHLALADLQVYLGRAGRVEDGSVRLIAAAGVLAVYSAILYPHGLLDQTPTVLGLRTFATDAELDFDVVVPVRSLLDRVARLAGSDGVADGKADGPIGVSLPLEVGSVTWAGISPPRGGWRKVGDADAAVFERAATAGIDEVAEAIPEGTGAQLVQRVRFEVWGREIEGYEYLPAGGAFAAHSLGFLNPPEPIAVFETGPWTRLSTRGGHVLVHRKPWRLKP